MHNTMARQRHGIYDREPPRLGTRLGIGVPVEPALQESSRLCMRLVLPRQISRPTMC